MKKILFFLILPVFVFSQHTAKVIGIKDGDTVVILDSLKNQVTLRLADVDCPENNQPFGKNAKQFTSDQIFGKTVKYYITTTDRYNRSISKIYYDNGKYLSEEIIKNGLGWWYYKYSKDKNLGKLENQASSKKLGLFQDPNAIPPWIYREERRNSN
ncbi:thermonuclease family protein [Chryseobacterium sp. 3008163]|uniref:thermonuclease family protein n=1 Tax=Chryseobacterium sp. 3008163 TaxID=2478663 RepID=UPI001E64FC1A|nr:thermonuclease family protein [Chryseobacterium sp. 3008163]